MLRTAIFNDGENFRHSICGLFAGLSGAPFNSERDLFDRRDYLPKQADWEGFFSHLVAESRIQDVGAYLTRAYWYVVENVDVRPWKLPKERRDPVSGKLRFDRNELAKWRERNMSGIQELVDHDKSREKPSGLSAKIEGTTSILKELRRRKAGVEGRFRGFAEVQSGIARSHDRIEFRRSGGIPCDLFTNTLGREKTTDVNLAVDMMRLKDTYDMAVIISGDQDFVPAATAVKDLGKRVVNVSFKTKGGELLPTGAWRLNVAVDKSVEIPYDTFRRFMFPNSGSPGA